MAFEGLTEKLSGIFKKLRFRGKLSESDIKMSMREVRLALLEADVNYKIASKFVENVTERAIGIDVMKSLSPAQMVIKIVSEELTKLMGEEQSKLKFSSKPPSIVMLCGLQGSGKTTHAAKLALLLKKQNHRPLLVACDVYRPAAIKQLQVLGKSVNVPVFEMGQIQPKKIVESALKYSKDYGNDVLIIDTAGRLQIDEKLMEELKILKNSFLPQEVLLVVDAMTGQDAVNVAKSYNDLLDISGVILTKLDGDTRGGAALSIRATINKPIKFAGVGEKISDIEPFHPERMSTRILGMGDVLSLIENAERSLSDKEAQKIAEKFKKNNFDLNDLLDQFSHIKKLGSLKSIVTKIPGISSHLKDVEIDDRIMDRTCAIMLSMSDKERREPECINASRKQRIAKGSGMKVEDVNRLLKQFEQMRKTFKRFGSKKKISKLKLPNFKF